MKLRRRSDAIGIEIAPLIDIVFILLIFFVVTSTFMSEQALEVQLPSSESTAAPAKQSAIEVVISANDEIRINQAQIPQPSLVSVKEILASLKDSSNQTPNVVIRADAAARHETVVLVLDAANLLGLTQVNILTVKNRE